jgi:ABC-type sulfate transport system permease subunit
MTFIFSRRTKKNTNSFLKLIWERNNIKGIKKTLFINLILLMLFRSFGVFTKRNFTEFLYNFCYSNFANKE